jgi:LPXTG-motif cell wall-anchored protein
MPVLALAIAAATWLPPVPGEPARLFDPGRQPFEGGRHRGVDLAAPPGTKVRAPCDGEVAFAGPAGTTGRVVTLRCGRWRVTHLPLATIAVRAGQDLDRGARLGTVARSSEHRGLHLGVRRDGERFGYVDPLAFLAPDRTTPPPLGRAPRPRRAAPPPRAAPPAGAPHRPPAATSPAAAPHRAPSASPAPAGSNPGPRAPFAPWPAWLGLALVLGGAGVGIRRRRTRTLRLGGDAVAAGRSSAG